MKTSFYQTRAQRFAEEEKACERQNSRYAWLRLLILVAAITFGIILYPISAWLSAVTVLVLLAVFAVCLKKHLTNIERQQQKERLKIINQQEFKCLGGNFSAYAPGAQYENAKHFYTSDLDIFGAHSLFRYLNRTTSPSGSDMLAGWLSKPAATAEIEARQLAVKELSDMVELRQEMQAIGLKYKDVSKELPRFIEWLHSDAELSGNRRLLRTIQILPWFTLAVTIAATTSCIQFGFVLLLIAIFYVFGGLLIKTGNKLLTAIQIIPWVMLAVLMSASIGCTQFGFVWLLLAVHFVIYGLTFKKVNLQHQQVSNKVKFISIYAGLIELFVNTKFSSPYLISIRNCFVENEALKQIKMLRNCIKKLDYRLNMLYIPINVLFFFDYKHLVWLEHWRANDGQKAQGWFNAIAKIEALSSFANALYNHPHWTMPKIRDEYFMIEAKNLGHPLISERERVCNDFTLNGAGKIAIVTGSNMSGKSTFERSIGINMALALAGAPVCADALNVTNCQLYTYMRIADHLEEQTSSFLAELKRLKQLIDNTKDGQQVFFLLDEVLRGTNSRDRQIGSMALVGQLVRQKVSGIIATHDLALGELEREIPHNVSNLHFDVQINGEDMSFDYKLYQGICTSLNASILMKKIGIEV